MTSTPDELVDLWWREHSIAVLRYARRRVPPADVEDVVAQTFTVAWRRSADVPALVLPWLLAVARRVAANTLRSRDRQAAVVARLVAEQDASGIADTEQLPTARVLEALDRLGERDRELLTLVAWDGLSSHEAAAALQCTQATFRVRLHRARARLRRLLDSPGPDDSAGTVPARATTLEQTGLS